MPNLSPNARLKLLSKPNKKIPTILAAITITIIVFVLTLLSVWVVNGRKESESQKTTNKTVSTNEEIKKWVKGQITTNNYSYEFEYPENWRFTERTNNNSIYFNSHGLGIAIYYSESGKTPLQNTLMRQIKTGTKTFDVRKGSPDSAVNYSTDLSKNNFTASVWVEKDFPTQNDYIFDRIVTSLNFTYTKSGCGNQIEKLTYVPPANWTKNIEMPCASTLSFKSPESTGSSSLNQLGASISITLYFPYDTFEQECTNKKNNEDSAGNRKNIDCTKIIKNKKTIYSTFDDEGYSITYEIWYSDTEIYSVSLHSQSIAETNKFVPILDDFLNNLKFN